MKLIHFHRKPISMFVMFTFTILLCFWANQAPAAPTAAKNSEATMEQGDSHSPNFIEQEKEPEAAIKKGKKFPWLIVGAVVVIGAAAVYFLVIKKPQYTLTVNVGAGATGTPAATAKFKKGEAVPYSYTPQAGYGNLQVKLDGVAVAASGSVTMDKDHSLDVTASQQFTLTVNLGIGTTGTPAATATYNKDEVVPYNYTAQAGYTNLQVTLDGAVVGASGSVTMDANHTLNVTAAIQKYTLTVHLGAGATGTPAATAIYNKGQIVSFSYTAQAGYSSLLVKLDNVAVGASGNVAMNSDHTLDVSAAQQYTLTVSLGAGTTGTPAATAKYNKDQVVNYSYATQAGYSNLQVKLDGVTVGASGSFAMNGNRALATSAVYGATVNINSTPSGAKIFDNYIDNGRTTNTSFNYTIGGVHMYVLRKSGYQDYSKTENVVLGKTININATLLPGILDDFLLPATFWAPHTASEWTISNGVYKFVGNQTMFNYSIYNYSFSQTNWTAEVKMKRMSGNTDDDNAIVLIEKMVGSKAYGYWFSYQGDGSNYWIIRFNGFDIYNGDGDFDMLRNGGASMVHRGLNQWNTIKVVRAGGQYSFYINDTEAKAFTDSRYNPHYLALGIMMQNKKLCEMQYDYVRLDFSASSPNMSPEPFAKTTPTKKWLEHNK